MRQARARKPVPAAALKLPVGCRVLPALAMLIALLLHAPGGRTAPPLLIRSAQPVDSISGVQARQDLLLRDGVIVAMGEVLDVPADATVIDADGGFLIPGLWDMHVHLTYDARLSAVMPDLFLDYGVTSVRDTGGLLDEIAPFVAALRESQRPTPRVFFAGPLLDGRPVVYDGVHAAHLGIEIATPETAGASVARLANAGVDFIKIYEMVTPAVFDALVAAAAEHDLPVAAHVPLSMPASGAGPQVDSLEHLRNIEMDCAAGADALLRERRDVLDTASDDGMALRTRLHAAQRNRAIAGEDAARCASVIASLASTIQVPTARLNAMTQYPPFRRDDWHSALQALPRDVAEAWAKAPDLMSTTDAYRVPGEWTLRMLPRLRDAGIPIGAGTDTPIGWALPGYSLHSELEILVAAGLTPREALNAATRVPASFFNLEEKMGRVSVGQIADLVLLGGNPLEDIGNTRRIRAVIAAGRLARGAALANRTAQAPGRAR